MNRKRISQFVAFLAVQGCLLLPAEAAPPQDKTNIPMLSLLLFSSSENVMVTPCASRDISGSEIVIVEGLEWQRCDDQRTYSWDQAVNYCQNIELNGATDWRLPTKYELKAIVDCSNGKQTPLSDPDPYKGIWNSTCALVVTDKPGVDYDTPTISNVFVCDKEKYWTATATILSNQPAAWTVDFEDGGAAIRTRSETYKRLVRCIRPI